MIPGGPGVAVAGGDPNAEQGERVANQGREPGVLVVPTDFRAGPWACRSLSRGGYRVVGAQVGGRLAGGRSLACPRPLRHPPALGNPSGFVEALREMVRKHSIAAVLPTSEDVVRVLARAAPDLGAVIVGPDAAQYGSLCDKGALALAAAEAGVDHPASQVVGAGGAQGEAPPLPCVVKPRISGEEAHGVAVASTVRTAQERDAAVAALLEQGRDALVQQLLGGPRWFVHSTGLGDRFRFMAFRAIADYPRGSGPGSFVHTADAPAGVREATERLVALVGYEGPVSISFIEEGGRLYVHDVNLRLGATVGASIRAGFDLPRDAVNIALGRTAAPERTRRPITYVRLDGELGSAIAALRGDQDDAGAGELFGRVAKGLLAPGWMLDPSPLDPFLLGTLAARRLRSLAGRARRRPGAPEGHPG